MKGDARVALDRLVAAFETHFAAVLARRDGNDPTVENAYIRLADAFEAYDEALMDSHDETTPFVLYEDEDDFYDEDDEDDLDDEDDIASLIDLDEPNEVTS